MSIGARLNEDTQVKLEYITASTSYFILDRTCKLDPANLRSSTTRLAWIFLNRSFGKFNKKNCISANNLITKPFSPYVQKAEPCSLGKKKVTINV